MKSLQQQLRKYFIMGSQNCNRDPEAILTEAAQAGITAFQYREKGTGALTGAEKLSLGRRLKQICRQHDVLFIVNDDIDLAASLHADGIHLGQEDGSLAKVRRLFPDKIIGLSVSSTRETEASPVELADYLGAGPIFDTSTKEDVKQAVGVEWIRSLNKIFPDMPIVGIGGIAPENAPSVLEAGADGVAVISAIAKAPDIPKAVYAL